MRPRVLCAMPEATFRRMFTEALRRDLESLGDVTYCFDGRDRADADYSALWRSADGAVTGWGVRPPTAEMLRSAPLRVIAHTAGSVRMFPREAIEQGIVVTTARAGIARTVAEYCLMSAILLLRRYSELDRVNPAAPKLRNETLFDKTVGLVGYGCVGREFRALLRPFGCRVLVFDPFLSADEAFREEIEPTDLDNLLMRSKVVSLHAPDIPETRGMIDGKHLALISDGAVLINSARGSLIDTDALTRELSTRRFYAAIDVTDPEPLPADHPLRRLRNVSFTPHVAGPTEDDLPRMTRMALDDLAAILRGKAPRYSISLEDYDRMSY